MNSSAGDRSFARRRACLPLDPFQLHAGDHVKPWTTRPAETRGLLTICWTALRQSFLRFMNIRKCQSAADIVLAHGCSLHPAIANGELRKTGVGHINRVFGSLRHTRIISAMAILCLRQSCAVLFTDGALRATSVIRFGLRLMVTRRGNRSAGPEFG